MDRDAHRTREDREARRAVINFEAFTEAIEFEVFLQIRLAGLNAGLDLFSLGFVMTFEARFQEVIARTGKRDCYENRKIFFEWAEQESNVSTLRGTVLRALSDMEDKIKPRYSYVWTTSTTFFP